MNIAVATTQGRDRDISQLLGAKTIRATGAYKSYKPKVTHAASNAHGITG